MFGFPIVLLLSYVALYVTCNITFLHLCFKSYTCCFFCQILHLLPFDLKWYYKSKSYTIKFNDSKLNCWYTCHNFMFNFIQAFIIKWYMYRPQISDKCEFGRHLTQKCFGKTAWFCPKGFFCYSPADGEGPCCLSINIIIIVNWVSFA